MQITFQGQQTLMAAPTPRVSTTLNLATSSFTGLQGDTFTKSESSATSQITFGERDNNRGRSSEKRAARQRDVRQAREERGESGTRRASLGPDQRGDKSPVTWRQQGERGAGKKGARGRRARDEE